MTKGIRDPLQTAAYRLLYWATLPGAAVALTGRKAEPRRATACVGRFQIHFEVEKSAVSQDAGGTKRPAARQPPFGLLSAAFRLTATLGSRVGHGARRELPNA